MSGLECKEKLLSEVLKNNITNRIDSEYFLKSYDKLIDLTKNAKTFSELKIKASGGKRIPQSHSFVDEGTTYVRAEDIKNNIVDWEESPKVQEKTFNVLKRYQMFNNDVVITNVGSVGDIAIVKNKDIPILMTENCVRLDTKNSKVTYGYLFTFMMSTYGQAQIEREKVGTVQSKLSLERIRDFRIPKISEKLQLKLNEVVDEFSDLYWSSKKIYNEAENILLNELGFNELQLDNDNISILSLKDSFSKTGRLDSEYYLKKYDSLFESIVSFKHKTLGDLVSISNNSDPGSSLYRSEGIPFIRVADITKYGLTKPNIYLPIEYAQTVKVKPQKDTILLTKDGSIGIAYKTNEFLDIVTSGAFLHLNIKKKELILPDYLTLLLNSPIVKLQAERDSGGSIIKHWLKNQINKVIIPILDIKKQENISNIVSKSFEKREQSQKTLNMAIRIVEIAIKEGEQKAFEYLKNNIK